MKSIFHISALRVHRKKQRAIPAHAFVNPKRDWTIGLLVAVFIFCLSCAYIAYDFYTQFIIQPDAMIVEGSTIKYNETEVRRLAEIYQGKVDALISKRTAP